MYDINSPNFWYKIRERSHDELRRNGYLGIIVRTIPNFRVDLDPNSGLGVFEFNDPDIWMSPLLREIIAKEIYDSYRNTPITTSSVHELKYIMERWLYIAVDQRAVFRISRRPNPNMNFPSPYPAQPPPPSPFVTLPLTHVFDPLTGVVGTSQQTPGPPNYIASGFKDWSKSITATDFKAEVMGEPVPAEIVPDEFEPAETASDVILKRKKKAKFGNFFD